MAPPNPLLLLPTLADDLGRVESQLRLSVQAEDPFLTEVASHLILAGGKRVRPAFAVTSAATRQMVMGPATPEVISGGVSVELVHLGPSTTTTSWTTPPPAAPSRASTPAGAT